MNTTEPINTQESPQTDQFTLQLDVGYLRTLHVHFALPCYGGTMTEQTFMSFLNWSDAARQVGMKWTVQTLVNESLISRGRNTLAAKFLGMEDPKPTHLMFIDSDIGFEPWHVFALLMRTMDPDIKLIGGLYPMKTMPLKWVVNGLPGGHKTADGLEEVTKIGTGFMLIDRSVFTTLDTHPEIVGFKNDLDIDPKYDVYMKNYFDAVVRNGRYLSEDWSFCERYRELGGRVWADKRIQLRHTGSYVYSVEGQNAFAAALKAAGI